MLIGQIAFTPFFVGSLETQFCVYHRYRRLATCRQFRYIPSDSVLAGEEAGKQRLTASLVCFCWHSVNSKAHAVPPPAVLREARIRKLPAKTRQPPLRQTPLRYTACPPRHTPSATYLLSPRVSQLPSAHFCRYPHVPPIETHGHSRDNRI